MDENKTALSDFLVQSISLIKLEGKRLCTTQEEGIFCSGQELSRQELVPSDHEQADTRILLHVHHCANHGHKKVIRTVDKDVVVLAVASFYSLPDIELWIHFGVNKHHRFISAPTIAQALGEQKQRPYHFSLLSQDATQSHLFVGQGKRRHGKAGKPYHR